jgi:Spy/CpxP family protein refolding chaperone
MKNIVKTKVIILALALGASTCLLTAQDGSQPPDGQRPPGREGGPGGPGGQGGQGGFHLLPPRAQEQLNLTADQQKQVAALEAKVKAKLEKILTPEQLKQLKQMRPPGRPGGPGGPGGQGGPAGQGGPGGEGRPQRPAQEQ